MDAWNISDGAGKWLGRIKASDARVALKRGRKAFPDAKRPLKAQRFDFVYGVDPGKRRFNPSARSTRKRVSRALTKYVRNFTGTITRTGDGQVVIAGTGPKPVSTRKNPKRRTTARRKTATKRKR